MIFSFRINRNILQVCTTCSTNRTSSSTAHSRFACSLRTLLYSCRSRRTPNRIRIHAVFALHPTGFVSCVQVCPTAASHYSSHTMKAAVQYPRQNVHSLMRHATLLPGPGEHIRPKKGISSINCVQKYRTFRDIKLVTVDLTLLLYMHFCQPHYRGTFATWCPPLPRMRPLRPRLTPLSSSKSGPRPR